ncbi:hypothetical protein METP3_01226 [Methanosarcinales archaeon]|nr:MAG: hypothetical protein OI861_00170 [Candidatus Methanoperedens sp.]CAG0967339.1 hypothetical protein METP3_01226 [Methanosarcinales archaeon]
MVILLLKQLDLEMFDCSEKILRYSENGTAEIETVSPPAGTLHTNHTLASDCSTTVLQEARDKTNIITEIALKHPDIIVKSGSLPCGFIISYHLKGGNVMSKQEAETEFVQKIKKAVPIDLRKKHDYFRGTITRELDKLTVFLGPNFRFSPVANIQEVIALFDDARTRGVGKKEMSIEQIVEAFWEKKDEINSKAEELGIAERIENKDQLQRKIRFVPLIFDISFQSAAMGIDSSVVSQMKSDMEKEFKIEIERDLKSRMQDILERLSKSLKTIKCSQKGKPMNKRTHDSLIRNLEEIEKLNITQSDELKNMIRLSKALTEGLATQDLLTSARSIEDDATKTPEEIFKDAFRKSAPVDVSSKDELILNSVIEEIASQL